MAVASPEILKISRESRFLFAFPCGEVMPMYLTIEQLFLIAGFTLALLTYIDHKNKKK